LKIIWKGIQMIKSVIGTLFFFLLLFILYGVFFTNHVPAVPGQAALIIDPAGIIVERKTYKDTWDILLEDKSQEIPETLLRDIGKAIQTAKYDERITVLVLNMDYLYGAGLAQLHYIGQQVEDFKESGKPVLAYGLGFSNGSYLVASFADEIYMHPYGAVFLTGYGVYPVFYKSALDKIKTKVHVFRSGPYKAYGEPYLRDDMSDEAKEANRAILDILWGEFVDQIAGARGIEPEAFQASYQTLAGDLRAVGGDLAQLPVEQGLIDGLMSEAEWGAYMAEMVGDNGYSEGYSNIHMAQYLEATAENGFFSGDQIAVVVARGGITFGENRNGTAGSHTIIKQLREARLDDDVKAVVLRIDSPGGSLLASELIREQVELLKEAGKPVIASMGAVAASGGYWIAVPADEIWAQPTTITGSIGVIGIVPTFVGTLDAIGIHVDGVGTTPLSGDFMLGRPLSPLASEILQQSVENSYAQFVDMVAGYRGLEPEAVDAIGQGRVWSGQAAYEFGLVDSLGNLDDAIAAAGAAAGLSGYEVKYLEEEPDFSEQLAEFLTANTDLDLEQAHWRPGAVEGFMFEVRRTIERLGLLDDPSQVYVLCEMCEIR
jgi:protease-4